MVVVVALSALARVTCGVEAKPSPRFEHIARDAVKAQGEVRALRSAAIGLAGQLVGEEPGVQDDSGSFPECWHFHWHARNLILFRPCSF